MKYDHIKKILVCGIIILLIGTNSILSMETAAKESTFHERKELTTQQRPQRTIAQIYLYAFNGAYGAGWYSYNPSGYLGPSILPNFPSGSDIDLEGNWYAVNYEGGIYQIYYNGDQEFIAPSIPLNGFTYDSTTDTWYGCDETNLYTIDISTGETTVVGPLGAPNLIMDIACNIDGEMYGYDVLFTGLSCLYSINKDTGAATVIGSTGVGFLYAGDCCFDRDNDILYIASYNIQSGMYGLYICDVETGAVTLVGTLTEEVDALTFPYMTENWMLYPRANFTWSPPTPEVGETILFNASASHDDDGYITLYEWDWNHDGVYDESDTIPTVTHVWTSPGSYNVTLRVTDNTGLTTTKSHIVEVITVNHPPATPNINGPTNGTTNHAYTFSIGPITDPDGDSMYCKWDWGDGNITDWLGPYPSGQIITASHSWSHSGVLWIRVKLKDTYGAQSNWSAPHSITLIDDQPPATPSIIGSAKGKPNATYLYSFVTTDPENEPVSYFIDWGDGTNSSWLGPYESGVQKTASHSWSRKGTYIVKVKAKDVFDSESDWGRLIVMIPCSYIVHIRSLLEWLFERFPQAFPLLRLIVNLEKIF
jgi:hypothetical protein